MRFGSTAVAILLACALMLGACADQNALSGTSWRLDRLAVDGHVAELVPTVPVTLQFQTDGVNYIGSSGCNYYSGSYVISGHQLQLRFKDVTARACAGPIMSQEVAYLEAMEQVQSYQMNAHILTMKDGDGRVVLTFDAT